MSDARNLRKAHSHVFVRVPQIRHYNSVKWVTTEETSFFMGIAAMRAFRRLYTYISGTNENVACVYECVCTYHSLSLFLKRLVHQGEKNIESKDRQTHTIKIVLFTYTVQKTIPSSTEEENFL